MNDDDPLVIFVGILGITNGNHVKTVDGSLEFHRKNFGDADCVVINLRSKYDNEIISFVIRYEDWRDGMKTAYAGLTCLN